MHIHVSPSSNTLLASMLSTTLWPTVFHPISYTDPREALKTLEAASGVAAYLLLAHLLQCCAEGMQLLRNDALNVNSLRCIAAMLLCLDSIDYLAIQHLGICNPSERICESDLGVTAGVTRCTMQNAVRNLPGSTHKASLAFSSAESVCLRAVEERPGAFARKGRALNGVCPRTKG